MSPATAAPTADWMEPYGASRVPVPLLAPVGETKMSRAATWCALLMRRSSVRSARGGGSILEKGGEYDFWWGWFDNTRFLGMKKTGSLFFYFFTFMVLLVHPRTFL